MDNDLQWLEVLDKKTNLLIKFLAAKNILSKNEVKELKKFDILF